MKHVIVKKFGDPSVLELLPTKKPKPGPGQVLVSLTSIGLNHADLMARRGEYKISSGPVPFTPGIEGGGVIEEVGTGVVNLKVGDRIILGADAPAVNTAQTNPDLGGGTYKSHYMVSAEQAIPAPNAISDDQLGAIWLSYLTAWGCLVWKQNIKPGQFVAIPAASSSVGMAAAQIVKRQGAVAIGLTSSPEKIKLLEEMPENSFDHLVATHKHKVMRPWHRDLRKITGRHGVDVFFDPVAAGAYLNYEILSLAQGGTVWIYGLLGQHGEVDVTPLIRKSAAVRGWYLYEVSSGGPAVLKEGYDYILKGFEDGVFRQRVAKSFPLSDVQQAHIELDKGRHIGKMVLVPNK